MKKIFVFLLFLVSFLWFSFAENHCVSFDKWKLCLELHNKGDWVYNFERKFYDSNSKDEMFTLNCKVLLPNWKLKDIWTCGQSFEYDWNSKEKVKVYLYFEWGREIVDFDYHFLSLTESQINELEKIYKIWPDFIKKIKSKYTNLKSKTEWKTFSSVIYSQLWKLLKGEGEDINSYSKFKKVLLLYIKYTQKLIW